MPLAMTPGAVTAVPSTAEPTYNGLSGRTLMECHELSRGAPQRKDALLRFHDLVNAIREGEEDEACWIPLIDGGAFGALLSILADRHFCGFDAVELTSWQEQGEAYLNEVLAYAHATMQALVVCLGCFVDHFRRPAAQEIPAIVRKMLSCTNSWLAVSYPTWKSLWEVKTPVLDSQFELFTFDTTIAQNLKLACMRAATIDSICFDEFKSDFPALKSNPGYMLHVVYTLWVTGTSDKRSRPPFLHRMWDTLVRGHPDINDGGCPEFYYEAVTGTTGPNHLAQAYIRDFRLAHQSHSIALFTLRMIFCLRPARDGRFPMGTRLERTVVFRSIAACRTLLCTPDVEGCGSLEEHFELEALFLLGAQLNRLLPEVQSHEVLAFVAKFLIAAIEDNNVNYVATCRRLIINCGKSFADGKRENPEEEFLRPALSPLTAMRWYSSTLWQKTADVLHERAYVRDPRWKELVVHWTALGHQLDVVRHLTVQQEDEYDARRAFPPLTRCGWDACLCSIHEPLHPMKACKGCWLVAYCNATCQARDWIEGDHQRSCRNRRRT